MMHQFLRTDGKLRNITRHLTLYSPEPQPLSFPYFE